MGFDLSAIVSSPVSPELRVRLIRAAIERWPFLRLAKRVEHPERLVLGGVEHTSHHSELTLPGLDYDALMELFDARLIDELPAFTRAFPGVAMAYVRTQCFGGVCDDEGGAWRDGAALIEHPRQSGSASLPECLAAVELETDGYFAGFVRDHFAPALDPAGAAHGLLPAMPALFEELDDAQGFQAFPMPTPPPSPRDFAGCVHRPRRLRALVATATHVAGEVVLVGPRAPAQTPLLDALPATQQGELTVCVADEAPDDGDKRERIAARIADAIAPALAQGWAPPEVQVAFPRAVAKADAKALTRAFSATMAERRPPFDLRATTLRVLDGPSLAATSALHPAEHPSRAAAALWLGHTLDATRAGGPLHAQERALIDALDAALCRPGEEQALAVFGDWLAGNPGHETGLSNNDAAEALALDLRLRELSSAISASSSPSPELRLLRQTLEARGAALSSPPELELRHIAKNSAEPQSATRPRLHTDWWPQIDARWRGPWLTRLVIRAAWPFRFEDRPGRVDDWTSYHRPALPYTCVAALLALPAARYLSERRVTLLRSPASPDLAGRTLDELELGPLDLRQASLSGASLRGVQGRDSALNHADLRGADLRGADLRRADFRRADLRFADLRNVRLDGADLRFADLRGATSSPTFEAQVEPAALLGARR